MAYPLYEVIAEAGLPALFHTGHSGIGSGMPGGGGLRLKYSNPIYVDDVAADFPEMPIVLAHPSFPWQDEALSIAMHKPEVYIDLSGWSPKYFPPLSSIQYANTLLKHQVLFGSDYPMITPDRWLRDFEQLDIDDEVRPLILKENAARLLRPEEQLMIDPGGPGARLHPRRPGRQTGRRCRRCAAAGSLVYFYPKADTPGCTAQACGIRDHSARLRGRQRRRAGRVPGHRGGAARLRRQVRARVHAALGRGRRGGRRVRRLGREVLQGTHLVGQRALERAGGPRRQHRAGVPEREAGRARRARAGGAPRGVGAF